MDMKRDRLLGAVRLHDEPWRGGALVVFKNKHAVAEFLCIDRSLKWKSNTA